MEKLTKRVIEDIDEGGFSESSESSESPSFTFPGLEDLSLLPSKEDMILSHPAEDAPAYTSRNITKSDEEFEEDPFDGVSIEDRKTIELLLKGYRIIEIAATLGVAEATIQYRMKKQAVRRVLSFFTSSVENRLLAAYGKAADVYIEGLDDGDKEFKLKCSDRIMKILGKDGSLKASQNESLGAEALAQKMIQEFKKREVVINQTIINNHRDGKENLQTIEHQSIIPEGWEPDPKYLIENKA